VKTLFRFSQWMESASGYSPAAILAFVVHIPNFVRLIHRLLQDPRVPLFLKSLCYGSLAYLIYPNDLIRDYPNYIFGHVDDAIVLFLAFRKLIRDSPPEVVREHVEAISRGRGKV